MPDSQTRELKLYHDFALEPLAARGCIRTCNKNHKQAHRIVPYIGQAPGFENIAKDGDFVPRPDDRPLTKFEARGHRLGHGVWDIKYKRIA